MAADKSSGQEKTLEMRVAELEDKLSKVHITEEEIKAYHKVAAALSMQSPGAASASPAPITGINCIACINCITCRVNCIIACRIIADCIQSPAGGAGVGGAGFSGLGM